MPPKTAAYYKKQKERDKKRRQKEEEEIQAEHDANGTPGERKATEAREVAANLVKAKRNPVPVEGDGECFYSAVLHQMRTIGNKVPIASTKELRSLVAEHMRRHADDYAPFLPEEGEAQGTMVERLDAYCRLVEGNAWGTQLEIRASSEVLGKRIAVVTQEGISFYGGKADEPEEVQPSDWCIIFLHHGYTLGGHFNSTNNARNSNAANAEDE
eukprot:GILI01015763.1.p1 GENE.GILI01015763.1~~GILI01015763.1.p1  ORF type:complete len:213 (-),score=43.91 GILI01015763.1:32-670(-)